MWQYNHTNELMHFGVKGMRWGHRQRDPGARPAISLRKAAYAVGAKINPREGKYAIKKAINRVNANVESLASLATDSMRQSGKLTTNVKALQAIESMGIATHKKTKYDNLDAADLKNLKTYTDSARYSRGVNGFLAIGIPKEYAADAAKLKKTLQKNSVDGTTVYRSCSLTFSTKGLAKKLDTMNEEELSKAFAGASKHFAGKTLTENRVFSTSTSPLFAIDTWRAVNPTAASTYNTYMIINCNKTPGLLADGSTKEGKALVNTRSNQEAILAPNKLTYKKMEFDEERGMFAVTLDAT